MRCLRPDVMRACGFDGQRINSAAPIGVGWNDVLGVFLENTMRDDYYYSGQYAEEQAEAEAQAKEGAHRQGKWHVSEHTDGRDALVYDADGFEVARVCYPNRDADARLIAVAPELLAAAQAALHYMRLHKYADQAWADDLEAAITQAMTPNAGVQAHE